jgi:hypothetical protein
LHELLAMREASASRRRFFMHPAHQTIGISAGTSAWQACHEIGRPAAEPPRPRRACLLWTGTSDGRLSAPILAQQLRQSTAADGEAPSLCIQCQRPAALDLDGCDCLVLPAGTIAWEDWQVRCVRRYWRRGGGMVVLGAAGLVFPGWPELAREVIGGDCRPARAAQTCRIMPAATAGRHPILSGVGPLRCRGGLAAGCVQNLAADATVLLTASGASRSEPAAWTRCDPGRVFATILGAGDECPQAAFFRLLVNAVAWACEAS